MKWASNHSHSYPTWSSLTRGTSGRQGHLCSDACAEQRTCRRCRSLARAAHQRCSWANIFPERTVVFPASCVATAAPKAVIAIAGTDNMTWHHNFKFQSKPLYHQQRGQHSHLADMGVFHWWLHISFKAFSSLNPASWLCSCLHRAREQGTKKLYWKANRATAAFLNSWPAAEGGTHTGVLSHPR